MLRRKGSAVLVRALLAAGCALGVVTAVAGTAPAGSSPDLGQTLANVLEPSGQAVPHGDLPGWKQIYSEDFGTNVPLGSFPGAAYGSTWGAYQDGWPDTAAQIEGGAGRYFPSKTLSVSNGALNIDLHSENGVHLVSAPTPTLPGMYGQTYGRYSVRFRADPVPGYKVAWLLWPDSEKWPSGGEIDFPEGGLDGTISAYAHYANSAGGQDVFEPGTSRFTDWHTATIEWIPGKITFLLDGQVFGTSTRDVPADPMHWVLQTETCIGGCQPQDSVTGNVQIDWVSVWSYSPTTAGSPPSPIPIAPTPTPTTTATTTGTANPAPTSSGPSTGWTIYAPPAPPSSAALPTASPPAGTGWTIYAPPAPPSSAVLPTASPPAGTGWTIYAPPALP